MRTAHEARNMTEPTDHLDVGAVLLAGVMKFETEVGELGRQRDMFRREVGRGGMSERGWKGVLLVADAIFRCSTTLKFEQNS